MDVDGSAERRGPTRRVGVDVARARTDGRMRRRRRGGVDKERVTGSRYMAPAWKKDRRVPVADPGRTAKEETVEESRQRRRKRGTGDTEGTCYALRDMAEARGIHNFVKTKMLRSCLGGVAFFLVSRNVQARLSLALRPRPSRPTSPLRLLRDSRLLPVPSPPPRFAPSLPLALSRTRVPPLCPPCPSYLRASSLSRFSGNAPRNEKRFVKNVSASS